MFIEQAPVAAPFAHCSSARSPRFRDDESRRSDHSLRTQKSSTPPMPPIRVRLYRGLYSKHENGDHAGILSKRRRVKVEEYVASRLVQLRFANHLTLRLASRISSIQEANVQKAGHTPNGVCFPVRPITIHFTSLSSDSTRPRVSELGHPESI
jgi:hypothetical protein